MLLSSSEDGVGYRLVGGQFGLVRGSEGDLELLARELRRLSDIIGETSLPADALRQWAIKVMRYSAGFDFGSRVLAHDLAVPPGGLSEEEVEAVAAALGATYDVGMWGRGNRSAFIRMLPYVVGVSDAYLDRAVADLVDQGVFGLDDTVAVVPYLRSRFDDRELILVLDEFLAEVSRCEARGQGCSAEWVAWRGRVVKAIWDALGRR